MASDATPATIPTRTRLPELAFGPFVFDRNQRFLKRGDGEVPLPPRVLGVLELLLSRAGDIVARQELIDAVWKDAFVTDTSLAEAVSYLRQTLGDDPQSPTYVQTVHRRGYRFVSPVVELTPPPPQRSAPSANDVEPTPKASAVDVPVRPSIANELLPWSIAIISLVAALSAVWFATRRQPAQPPVVTVPIELMPGEQFDSRAPALAISPSGRKLTWSACRNDRCHLYVRDLESVASRQLAGTEGAAAPFFSPDELWIGFFADGKLKKVFVNGGGAVPITEASQPFGATWLADGSIVFAPSSAGGLMRVDRNGGHIETLTTPSASAGEFSHAYPSPAPGGEGVVFVVRTSPVPSAPGRLALLPHVRSEQKSWKVLVDGVDIGGAVGAEFLAFIRDGNLNVVSYDALRQTAGGPPYVLQGYSLAPHLALSPAGAKATVSASSWEPMTPPPPVWSWNLAAFAPPSGVPVLYTPALSPDGLTIAGVDTESLSNLWTVNLERGTKARLTYSGVTASPTWSGDSSRVFYASRRQAGFEIWARSSNAAGDETRILARQDRNVFPSSVSSDDGIAFVETGGSTRSDVGLLRRGATEPQMIAQTPFDETAPAISPDGTMMAYQSDESGRWEITLVRMSDARRSVVSRGGGIRPFWSHDGQLLHFEQDGNLLSVKVDPVNDTTSAPIVVSRLNGLSPVGITKEGAVLLYRPSDPALRADTGTLTINWVEHLRRTLVLPLPTTR